MMKNLKMLVLIFGIVTFLALSGCIGNDADSGITENSAVVPDSMMGTSPSASGTVVETMNSAGYTYVKIDTGSGEVWAAGPQTVVEVGDNVAVSGSLMKDFSSSSLGMTFDEIIFSNAIIISSGINGSTDSVPSPHGGVPVD
jgi:hypothetical protein